MNSKEGCNTSMSLFKFKLSYQIYEYEYKIQKEYLFYSVQFGMRNENPLCKNQHIITLYYYSIYC